MDLTASYPTYIYIYDTKAKDLIQREIKGRYSMQQLSAGTRWMIGEARYLVQWFGSTERQECLL